MNQVLLNGDTRSPTVRIRRLYRSEPRQITAKCYITTQVEMKKPCDVALRQITDTSSPSKLKIGVLCFGNISIPLFSRHETPRTSFDKTLGARNLQEFVTVGLPLGELSVAEGSSQGKSTTAMLEEDQQVRFTKLWTDAQPSVSRYVASLVRDQWAVRDIVQNTSLVLLRKFPEYDESRPFLSWAIGAAKFEILAHHRDAGRSRLICDSEFLEQYTQIWAEMTPALTDEAAALRHCIGALNGRPRTIIRLRYADGLTSEAIAGELRLSAANVRTILKRTRETLRRCIAKQIELLGGTA